MSVWVGHLYMHEAEVRGLQWDCCVEGGWVEAACSARETRMRTEGKTPRRSQATVVQGGGGREVNRMN